MAQGKVDKSAGTQPKISADGHKKTVRVVHGRQSSSGSVTKG